MSRKGWPRSSTKSEHVSGKWTDNSNGSTVYSYSFDAPYTSYSGDSIGPNTPGWPTSKQENPYTKWEAHVEESPVSFHDIAYHNNSTGDGTYPMSYLMGISDPIAYTSGWGHVESDLSWQRCVAKLIKNAKDQKVNVAQFAAEFKQTAGTVTNVARRLASAITAVKHGNLRQAVRNLSGEGSRRGRGANLGLASTGSVANDWLQLQYGWRPMLSDVYGACEELARLANNNPTVYKVTASATESGGGPLPSLNEGSGDWRPVITGKWKVKCSCHATLELEMASEVVATLGRTGITNPASLAWEELPYSFVVDWFLPVGDYLQSWDYDAGLIFKRGWYTIMAKVEAQWQSKATDVVTGSASTSFHADGSCTLSASSFQRTPLGGFPQARFPAFKDPTSLLHLANATALLRQAFS
ncbi:maturation protein [ssRNA phage Gerhypos.2_2]|uniref:Maturation protein n=2 Tax=Fiersviridae TaxID=2842319 RepID=A0A8S5L378_9VIRU|nr:maturation protein [ssRNA phage Gerhypos.2_2]QDH87582.1 MAG: hypothetical protein H2Bulk34148_000004 [Leviviridae sp.]DAD51839.1 TPA_asm: maturation protein [ssRNA phage Gerhypos.2_2]